MDVMSAHCSVGGGALMIECMRTVILRGCGLRSAGPQKPAMESLGCQGEFGELGGRGGCT